MSLETYSAEHEAEVPAPTAWPVVLALGVALLATGLVTTAAVSELGGVLMLAGAVGWFREVLPMGRTVPVPVAEAHATVATARSKIEQARWLTPELHRARLPLEVYPLSAGVKGGLAGGVAMALLAALYGFVSGHGIWYPVNLLAVGFFPDRINTEALSAFHWDMLLIASVVHLLCSVLVGLLFSATLPMVPRRPILFGGLIGPALWSGLLHSILDAINPVLNQRIDWRWFVVSQIGFGLVAGAVVSTQTRVRTWQHLPLAARAGIEESGESEEGKS